MINWMGGKRKRAQLTTRGPLVPVINRNNSVKRTDANSNRRIQTFGGNLDILGLQVFQEKQEKQKRTKKRVRPSASLADIIDEPSNTPLQILNHSAPEPKEEIPRPQNIFNATNPDNIQMESPMNTFQREAPASNFSFYTDQDPKPTNSFFNSAYSHSSFEPQMSNSSFQLQPQGNFLHQQSPAPPSFTLDHPTPASFGNANSQTPFDFDKFLDNS